MGAMEGSVNIIILFPPSWPIPARLKVCSGITNNCHYSLEYNNYGKLIVTIASEGVIHSQAFGPLVIDISVSEELLTDKVEAVSKIQEVSKVAKTEIQRAPNRQLPKKPEAEKYVENLTIAKRMLLTQREALELDSFAPSLAARVGTPIKLSHILRSAIRLVIENQSEILTEADKVKFRRPANGDMKGIEEFEMELAKVVLAGIKKGRG